MKCGWTADFIKKNSFNPSESYDFLAKMKNWLNFAGFG